MAPGPERDPRVLLQCGCPIVLHMGAWSRTGDTAQRCPGPQRPLWEVVRVQPKPKLLFEGGKATRSLA